MMTRREASREVFTRWGRALIFYRSRNGRHVISDVGPRRMLVPVGEGASWREACDAAERYRQAAARAAR
jgi:hypothetical protein